MLLIALPPDVPPAVNRVTLASQVGLELERAVSRHQPVQLNYTEDQVNAFLESILTSLRGGVLHDSQIDQKYDALRCAVGWVEHGTPTYREIEDYVSEEPEKKPPLE